MSTFTAIIIATALTVAHDLWGKTGELLTGVNLYSTISDTTVHGHALCILLHPFKLTLWRSSATPFGSLLPHCMVSSPCLTAWWRQRPHRNCWMTSHHSSAAARRQRLSRPNCRIVSSQRPPTSAPPPPHRRGQPLVLPADTGCCFSTLARYWQAAGISWKRLN